MLPLCSRVASPPPSLLCLLLLRSGSIACSRLLPVLTVLCRRLQVPRSRLARELSFDLPLFLHLTEVEGKLGVRTWWGAVEGGKRRQGMENQIEKRNNGEREGDMGEGKGGS